MNSIAYNIPVSLVESYRGRKLIVRAWEPSELVAALPHKDLDDILYVKLLSPDGDVDALANWGFSVPVDVVLEEPSRDYPKLYRHAKLLEKHPVRVSIPVRRGFSKAVKVGASLNFTVRLEPGQPPPELITELSEVLEFFLHHPSVSQPVEYFHGALMSFYHDQGINLWTIQEEDPAMVRYVTDYGVEIGSPRIVSIQENNVSTLFSLDDVQSAILAERGECSVCEFWERCGGYFKWPRREFACGGVKSLFASLRDAADDLKRDVSIYSEPGCDEYRADSTVADVTEN